MFHVGDVIRKLRKDRKLRLLELAKNAGLSPTTLGDLERHGQNFERDTLLKVARALDTNEATIYGMLEMLRAREQIGAEDLPPAADEPPTGKTPTVPPQPSDTSGTNQPRAGQPSAAPGDTGVADEHLEHLARVYQVIAKRLDANGRAALVDEMEDAAERFKQRIREEAMKKASGK